MLKIIQARLQQYVNCELPDAQVDFRKDRGTRDQITKARDFQKNKKQQQKKQTSISALMIMAEPFSGSQQIVENSSRNGNTRPSDLPLEKSVCRSRIIDRTGHGTTDWLQVGKSTSRLYIFTLLI